MTEGYKKLKDSALGLDGILKHVISPILAIICSAVAMLFTALLRFSVSPSDWKIAVVALIRKKRASKIDLNNFRAVHLLSFFYIAQFFHQIWRILVPVWGNWQRW